MIEDVDLSLKIEKDNYKKLMKDYELKLSELQRTLIEYKIPVILVFEGWGASGKGTLINRLILPMDPRGFRVYTTNYYSEEEKLRHFLWTFWIKTPEQGRIAIFDKSWYRKLLSDRVDENIEGKELENAFSDICTFERQMADSGTVILKFYLHISKKEQKRRFKELMNNESTKWRVTPDDLKHHAQYESYLKVIDEMIEKTDAPYAPWTILPANDSDYATIQLFSKIISTLEEKINSVKQNKNTTLASNIYLPPIDMTSAPLSKVDLSKNLDKKTYSSLIEQYQDRIRELEHIMYKNRIPLIVAYEGWDAAGKGGNIKRLTEKMDPRGYAVVPISAPTPKELSHHYLWRFWKEIPKAGHIAIFDRTWYGRVLVERIEGLCSTDDWQRAYSEINEMEKQLSNFGVVIVKFWLQIDKEEQLNRFQKRENTPSKQWKITDEDWRNRNKWNEYEDAINEMLIRTSTDYAPWTIIESNDKRYARIKALKTVIKALEKALDKHQKD